MNRIYPVYTVQTECLDCYKCVRQCPVKAIRIENGVASIIPERCIACGSCVRVCPNRAKRVRNDLPEVQKRLRGSEPVYASLAPSWVGAFPEWSASALIGALKKLGFRGVSETARGAQEVSAAVAEDLARQNSGVLISSACPAVVDYIRLCHPEQTKYITPIASPLLTHCALLRREFGDDIRIVFIGPCVAKKNEADRHPELLDVAITFEELRELFRDSNVHPEEFLSGKESFVPEDAREGTIYPIEGGMLETIRLCGRAPLRQLLAVSGIDRVGESLEQIRSVGEAGPIFVEALACPGGCIHGPCTRRASGLITTTEILRRADLTLPDGRTSTVRVPVGYTPVFRETKSYSDDAIRKALRRVGKTSPKDELNCGGCGYDSCRHFAEALLRGDAEVSQCVSHMRQLAMRKSNALLRCMPAGVVILDQDLLIVESNEAFTQIFGQELVELYQNVPGLSGADILTILPCEQLFRAALHSGGDIHREHYPIGERMFDLSIFTIDPGQVIGVIVQDTTELELGREQIAQRAEEVIARNITIVQEIACKLGEHMADTEILLSSIAERWRRTP
ncbi:MAG: [Fe-Fe] hydrogenase large subunit C-terminal domain-containing protein [Planctomycetia bacterium]|nr:[Fe-Fe] hydrogenase large subunit C-terminal domain-containing protein [Planctomycetia bacterium]